MAVRPPAETMNPLLDSDMNSFSERFLSERGQGSCLPAAPLKFGRVLVPMDLSRASVSGLRYAARVVPTFGGSIWPIYVQEPAPFTGGMESVVMAVSDTEAAEGASKLLARFCREAVDASRRGKIVVCIAQPVRQITAAVCSLDMDLIVMTTHGYTGLRRVGHPETPRSEAFEKSLEIAQPDPEAIVQAARRLRSDLIVMVKHDCSWWKHLGKTAVAERVVRTAPCPVLSVPEKALTEKSAAYTTPKAAEASPSPLPKGGWGEGLLRVVYPAVLSVTDKSNATGANTSASIWRWPATAHLWSAALHAGVSELARSGRKALRMPSGWSGGWVACH